MSTLKPIGRNQAIMELEGLFGNGERFACAGDDFVPGTIANVQQVLEQSKGKTRIHILFEAGGVSEAAMTRLNPGGVRPGRGGVFGNQGNGADREMPTFARSRRRSRQQEGRLIQRMEKDRIQDNPQSEHVIHDSQMNFSPETPQEQEAASNVSARGIPHALHGGFSTLINETCKALPGYSGGGAKRTADRPLNQGNRGSYLSNDEHAAAINEQLDPSYMMGSLGVDNRVGQIGGWRRSELQEERTKHPRQMSESPMHELVSTQEAVAEAVAAMEEDGINPRSPVKGLGVRDRGRNTNRRPARNDR